MHFPGSRNLTHRVVFLQEYLVAVQCRMQNEGNTVIPQSDQKKDDKYSEFLSSTTSLHAEHRLTL